MSGHFIKDVLLQLSFLGERGIKVSLELSHLVFSGLLNLKLLSIKLFLQLLELLGEGQSLLLVIVGQQLEFI